MLGELDCCPLQATLGTNPIAVAAPGPGGDDFVLDMATSAVAVGKVRLGVVLLLFVCHPLHQLLGERS